MCSASRAAFPLLLAALTLSGGAAARPSGPATASPGEGQPGVPAVSESPEPPLGEPAAPALAPVAPLEDPAAPPVGPGASLEEAPAPAEEAEPTGPDGEPLEGSLRLAPLDDALEIAGIAVRPGEKRELRLRTSESFAATDVDIPLVVIRGSRPGPTLCLTAGIHGDELNGIEIVREILETHQAEDLSGTLIGVPIVNLFGFINQSRYLPDRRDLNRHFPGRTSGSTASRIAHRLWKEVIVRCTHIIDFHTGSLHRSNLPQVRGDLTRPEILAFARAFGARVIMHSRGQRGTLRGQAVEHGIPTILYEAGETMRFQKGEIRKGVLGTRNVMVHLGMRRGRRVDLGTETVFLETHWVRAQHGGILDLYPALGEWVNKGQILGVITDPLRKDKGLLVSPWRGRIVGKVLSPMVLPGLAVVHIGVPGGRIEDTEAELEEIETDRPE